MLRLVAILSGLLIVSGTPLSTVLAEAPAALEYEVLSRRPHDDSAFTQGLQLDDGGRAFESTGLYGRSSLREVDPLSGRVIRRSMLPEDRFGEGLALVADRLIQLTWRSGEAFVWNVDSFELLETFEYDGEGWGLCSDGDRLIMSDGSDTLTFRDPSTFDIVGGVRVVRDGEPVDDLNELECVRGDVWANVWHSDEVLRIDPTGGTITGVLDLGGIIEPHPTVASSEDVLNGIAYDASTDSYLVTGKRWPELIEIRIVETTAP